MMNEPITWDEALSLRMLFQGLAQRKACSPVDLLKNIVGLQAQDYLAACLSLRARASGISLGQIESARQKERSIVRTWLMRGTLHLAAAADVGWILPYLGPIFAAGDQPRLRQLGWEPHSLEKGFNLLSNLFGKQESVTRAEIIRRLDENRLPSAGQAPIHLIFRAAMLGLLVQGPDRGKDATFVRYEDWLGSWKPLPAEEAVTRLARRYLSAYAPADMSDFAHWSGLKMADARVAWDALHAELIEFDLDDRSTWLLQDQSAALETIASIAYVRLLPRFDTYWMGYADHLNAIPPEHEKEIFPGGGIIHPAILSNGRAIGSWRSERKGANLKVKIVPFFPLDSEQNMQIQAEECEIRKLFA